MTLNLDRSTWKRARFGDIVNRSRAQVDQASGDIAKYVAGGHFTEGAVEVTNYGTPDDGGMGSTFTYAFRPGHVLYVSASWYLRKVGVATFDGVVADKTYVLESRDPTVVDQRFLPWILLSDELHSYAAAQSTGSMNARLLWSALAAFEFDLPPLAEQGRIADLLWAIERHRLAAAETAESLTATKSAVFADRLVAGVEQSGWSSDSVASLVEAGPTNGKSAPANDQKRGVPTLSIGAVRGGLVRGGDSVKFIDVEPASVDGFVLQEDDFLIVRGNGNRQLTGRGGLVVGGLPTGCIYPDLLIRLRFNAAQMLPQFAAEQWNGAHAHAALLENAKSTNGIWKINGKDIKSHRLVVPPLDEQTKLLAEARAFDRSIEASQAEANRLRVVLRTFSSTVFGGN